jgi:hypothetical protein
MSDPFESVSTQLRAGRDINSAVVTTQLRRCWNRLALTTVPISISDKYLSELFSLLVSPNFHEKDRFFILITGAIRELSSGRLPRFCSTDLSIYHSSRLMYVLSLVRQLDSENLAIDPFFLAGILCDDKLDTGIRLEAFAAITDDVDITVAKILLETPSALKSSISRFSTLLGQKSPQCFSLDGTVTSTTTFSPIHHMSSFSSAQLLHIGIFSNLANYVKVRFEKPVVNPSIILSAPPTPVSTSGMPQDTLMNLSRFSLMDNDGLKHFADQLVQYCIAVLAQCQSEINPVIFGSRKYFKHVPSENITEWTLAYMESVIVECVKILDIVASRDPSRVSSIFPHIRKIYERIILRPDSPGVAVCAVLKFFLNHSHLVIYDVDPALRFFFATHIPKLTTPNSVGKTFGQQTCYGRKSVLVAEAMVFLIDSTPLLCSIHVPILLRFFPALIHLVAWYPRLAGPVLLGVLRQILDASRTDNFFQNLLNTVCDIPLLTAAMEMSLDISDYVEPAETDDASSKSPDPFANGRLFMRLMRSSQFRQICDYVHRTDTDAVECVWSSSSTVTADLLRDLWMGLPITPRVSAAAKLVPKYLEVIFTRLTDGSPISTTTTSSILKTILCRYGSRNIFLFKEEMANAFIEFITRVCDESVLVAHRMEIVSAIVTRINQDELSLVYSLVFLIGDVPRKQPGDALPLFVRTLRWLLVHLTGTQKNILAVAPENEVVYLEFGRIVKSPSDAHPLLEQSIAPSNPSPHLVSVTVAAITKLASKFPQYRPQVVALLEGVHAEISPKSYPAERIGESLRILSAHHISRELVTRNRE